MLLVNLLFVPEESTHGYFTALKQYIRKYGKPRAIYTDKHAVFKVNTPGAVTSSGLTQFGRALKQLNIQAIFAHSPEAKGRVERANNTLQDRLVKELRFFNISTIPNANKFLKQYINEYNKKFSIQPKNNTDLHQNLTNREQVMLNNILSIQTTRKVNKNLIVKHNQVSYQLINVGKGHRYINQKVTICENDDTTIDILFRGKKIQHKIFAKATYKPKFAYRRDIDKLINQMHVLMHNNINKGNNIHGHL